MSEKKRKIVSSELKAKVALEATRLALSRQCDLVGMARSTVYGRCRAVEPDPEERALLALMDAEYSRRPFYGIRKMVVYRRGLGYRISRKRVPRLMGILGLAGMAPGPHTRRPHPPPQVYPYLRATSLKLKT